MAYIGNTSTTQAFTPAVDYFSGNGSTVAFTLSRPVASVAQVQVNVNNVQQNPGSAYTVSGNTITFTGAPSSGTNNIYVYYTSPITQVISPGQNTVYPSSLSYTNALYWDTSGNVGIGTSSPSSYGKLASVSADDANTLVAASASGLVRIRGYQTGVGTNIEATNLAQSAYTPIALGGSTFSAYTGGSERMRIDSSGNVGIGTSSPSYKLQVVGNVSISGTLTGGIAAPSVTTYSSSSGTYTTPSGAKYIVVEMVGAGGGGSGGSTSGSPGPSGTGGGNTTFGNLTAYGGSGGSGYGSVTGGSASVGAGFSQMVASVGGAGGTGGQNNVYGGGGAGGCSVLGGGGNATSGQAGGTAGSGSNGGGGGGGGGSANGGPGGGAGGYVKAIATSPSATYSWAVGSGGGGGASGGGSTSAGGTGGGGLIVVTAYF